MHGDTKAEGRCSGLCSRSLGLLDSLDLAWLKKPHPDTRKPTVVHMINTTIPHVATKQVEHCADGVVNRKELPSVDKKPSS